MDCSRLGTAEAESIRSVQFKFLRVLVAVVAILACIAAEFFLARAILESGFLPNTWCMGS